MPICANPECGREFKGRNKYCSSACLKRVCVLRSPPITCPVCGKQFKASKLGQKFCSQPCGAIGRKKPDDGTAASLARKKDRERKAAYRLYFLIVNRPMSDPYERPEFIRAWKASCGDTHKSALRMPNPHLGF